MAAQQNNIIRIPMIHIDRDRMPEPEYLRSERIQYARKELEAFFSRMTKKQSRPFDREALYPLLPEILKLGHGKCAYCEQPLNEKTVNIDTYRPKDMDRAPDVDGHYWWLAFTWNNLLPACKPCNAAKRNLFPVAAQRCAVGTTGEALDAEAPLLIDPAREDPGVYLDTADNGMLRPAKGLAQLDTMRAASTIELLQLNRRELVMARSEAMARIAGSVKRMLSSTVTPTLLIMLGDLNNEISASSPYAFAKRHALSKYVAQLSVRFAEGKLKVLWQGLLTLIQPYMSAPAMHKMQGRPVAQMPHAASNVEPRLMNVRRWVVENFRIIERAEIKVPAGRPADLRSTSEIFGIGPPEGMAKDAVRSRGWKMLLGENGSGKSSLLHALAIALMGRKYHRKMATQFASSLKHGKARGVILVEFENEKDTIEVEVTTKGLVWKKGGNGADVFLRGYGATRLLPKRSGKSKRAAKPRPLKWVDNLFEPHATLIDAETWLRSLGEDDFRQACLTLKDLLDIGDEDSVLTFETDAPDPDRKGMFGMRTVRAKSKHVDFTPLHHFSAGYQTIVALACDIMAGCGGSVKEMQHMPGIIIIDEIGTNLHPRWRTRILRGLERAFSNMQFIASTHEPLCLHGLGANEVAVVVRDKDHVMLHDNMPSPAGLRTDQLLTSEFFGLHTTIDPETERAFDVYYDLLAREHELSDADKLLLKQYREALNNKSVLGSSRRDQAILSAVDEILARRKKNGPSQNGVQPSEEVRAVIELALGTLDPRTIFQRT